MAAYARQAKDTAMVEWATEIKVRAERRAGQMLAEMPKAKGAQVKGGSTGGPIVLPPVNDSKTLAEIGITKNESSRWQKLSGLDGVITRLQRLAALAIRRSLPAGRIFGFPKIHHPAPSSATAPPTHRTQQTSARRRQQAAIVASAQDWGKAQIHGGDRKSNQSQAVDFDSVEKRSAASGASRVTQMKADKVAKANPELAKQVAHGDKSLPHH